MVTVTSLASALLVLAVLAAAVFLWRAARAKNIDIIVRAALRGRERSLEGPRHLFLSVADHFEPYWHNQDHGLARERVARWREGYPRAMAGLFDRGGRAPRHAFFYPQEEYRRELLDPLAELVREGFGEVEVHLHHENDTAQGLREKLLAFTHRLHDHHGLLHTLDDGTPQYAFIHGNWTLDNSDPQGRDCGVDDEITVLRDTGCYADFTYPSAPHPTQPPIINRVYYATGSPGGPASHHRGVDARYGGGTRDHLLMVTGPLTLNWRQRRRGLLPAVENGDITHINPVTPDRVAAWVRSAATVAGFPRWAFIKPYTHGAQEGNSQRLLSDGEGGLAWLYRHLLDHYNDGERFVVHFSTPWEMVRCIRILEAGDPDTIQSVENFSDPL